MTLEYFSPARLSFTRLRIEELLDGLARRLPGRHLAIEGLDRWGSTEVFVDPSRINHVVRTVFERVMRTLVEEEEMRIRLEPSSRGDFEGIFRAMNGLLPAALDDTMIRDMQMAGFKTLNLSLGSTSSKQLRRFNRPDVRNAFDRALKSAEKYNMTAVGYVIAGAPDQSAEESVDDLIYLSSRRVLAGISIFYPAPGSRDYERCRALNILPDTFSRMTPTIVGVRI